MKAQMFYDFIYESQLLSRQSYSTKCEKLENGFHIRNKYELQI